MRWREWLEVGAGIEPLAAFADDGGAALVGDGRRFYLGCWPDEALLASTLRHLLGDRARLPLLDLPPEVRLRSRGGLRFAFNYGDTTWARPPSAGSGRSLLGGDPVAPRDLACAG